MSRNWKPTKAQAREFADKMANDSDFKEAYEQRKNKTAIKNRLTSKFDYQTAGGFFIPTKVQYNAALNLLNSELRSEDQATACRNICYGYSCKAEVHHDNIHVINEFIRSKK